MINIRVYFYSFAITSLHSQDPNLKLQPITDQNYAEKTFEHTGDTSLSLFIKQYSMTIGCIACTVLSMLKVLNMLHCTGQGVFWLHTNTLSFSIK